MFDYKVAIQIKKTALMIEKLSNHVLAPYALTHTQYKILIFLYRNIGCPIRQIDIETYFAMINPSVTGIVQNLENKGMVQHIENPDDRRSKLLMLTEQAIAMKDELYALGEDLENRATEKLSEGERCQLIELLKKILTE